MGSKTIVILGLFLAIVLLNNSEVTARDLTETSTSKETTESTVQTNGVEDAKYGGGGYPGGGYGGYQGGGYGGGPGGGYGGYPGGGYGGRPGGGYGGGRRGGYGGYPGGGYGGGLGGGYGGFPGGGYVEAQEGDLEVAQVEDLEEEIAVAAVMEDGTEALYHS